MSALRSIIPEYDIELMRGDGEAFQFTITQGGTAVNLTNYTLRYTVKKRKTDVDADKILQKTQGNGISVTNAAGGIGTISFTTADFGAYTGSRNRQEVFVHDMQIQLPGDPPHTVFRGRLILLADVDNGQRMANGYVQVPPDSTGKKMDTEELDVNGQTVQRERDRIAGSAATELADVKDSDPSVTHHGLVVRPLNVAGPVKTPVSSASLAAGASANLDSDFVANGATGRLMGVLLSSSAAAKWVIKSRSGVTELEQGTIFTSGVAGNRPSDWFTPPDKRFCELSGNGTNTNFRVTVTNLDEKNSADVHATFFFDEAS